MKAKDLVSVKFIKPNSPYMSGEIAGFAPAVAARLVKEKKAVLNVPEEEKVVEPPAAPEPTAAPKAKAKKKPAAKSKKK